MDGKRMKIITIKTDENETSIEFEGIEDKLQAVGLLEMAKQIVLTEKVMGPSGEGPNAAR